MLVLDRFSGGLGFGFERERDSDALGLGAKGGKGLVGSAGMVGVGVGGGGVRKSVRVAERWGVDLSDVPVYVRGVGVGVEG